MSPTLLLTRNLACFCGPCKTFKTQAYLNKEYVNDWCTVDLTTGEVLRHRKQATNNLKRNVIVLESQTRAITIEASATPTHTGNRDADFQAVYDYMMRCKSIADFRGSPKVIHHILEKYNMPAWEIKMSFRHLDF